MNRSEIRRYQKESKKTEKIYTFKESELKEIMIKAVEKEQQNMANTIRSYAIRDLSAGVIDVLHLKFGFGRKRITRFFTDLNDIFIAINSREISIDDLIEACEKEIKFDFKLVYQDQEGKNA